ncbi:MAG TPA: class I SAM-dependent methyltransferase, partial [Ardenticatenaceae bacterium]|nr:class I SAM-dependent methyltransferase [Ardenticatenaceae bacterium]
MHPSEYRRLFENEERHWWFRARRRIARALLERHLPNTGRARRILDAGCGTGGNLSLLRDFGRVTGIDLSPIALAFARLRSHGGPSGDAAIALSRGSLLVLPFPDATFDLVTAFDVLYHLWIEDDVAAMAELYRVLKPGGMFLMTDSAWRRLHSAHDEMNLARERYETPELNARLERAGFEVIRASYANFLLLPLVLVVRGAQRLGGNGTAEPKSDVAPVPEPLNTLLYTAYRSEAALLPYVDFPR